MITGSLRAPLFTSRKYGRGLSGEERHMVRITTYGNVASLFTWPRETNPEQRIKRAVAAVHAMADAIVLHEVR